MWIPRITHAPHSEAKPTSSGSGENEFEWKEVCRKPYLPVSISISVFGWLRHHIVACDEMTGPSGQGLGGTKWRHWLNWFELALYYYHWGRMEWTRFIRYLELQIFSPNNQAAIFRQTIHSFILKRNNFMKHLERVKHWVPYDEFQWIPIRLSLPFELVFELRKCVGNKNK